jgi:hypothetical protein
MAIFLYAHSMLTPYMVDFRRINLPQPFLPAAMVREIALPLN